MLALFTAFWFLMGTVTFGVIVLDHAIRETMPQRFSFIDLLAGAAIILAWPIAAYFLYIDSNKGYNR